MWMLWQQSQSLGVTPSSLIGLTEGSYEAYCFDQAAWYFGSIITQELNQAGQKKQKGEAQVEAARKRVLDKFLKKPHAAQAQQFADPSALFS